MMNITCNYEYSSHCARESAEAVFARYRAHACKYVRARIRGESADWKKEETTGCAMRTGS